MLHPIVRTLVKVAIASLVLGAIMAHFGITVEQLMQKTGLLAERVARLADHRAGLVPVLSVPPATPAQQRIARTRT